MYKTLTAPLAVQIEVTDDCLEACSHCYRSCQIVSKASTKHLASDQAIHIVNEIARCKVFTVAFTGGEPLMYFETVHSGISRARDLGLACNLNTNLGLLTPEIGRFLRDKRVAVLTSLLSCEEKLHDDIVQLPGSYKKVLEGIKLLSDMGVSVSVNMVVRKENAHQVYETGRLAHRLGAIRFSATKAAPSPGIDYDQYRTERAELLASLDAMLKLQEEVGIKVDILESYPLCFFQNLDRYVDFARRNCTAGVFNCTISPDGDVRPCSHADISYGNIFNTPLQDCWLKMGEWRDGSLLFPKCKDCVYLQQCTGGCRFDAKYVFGDIRGPDPLMGNPKSVKPLSVSRKPSTDLPPVLQFSPYMGHREEDFGGVLKLNDEIVLLSKRGYELVSELISRDSFTIDELATPEMDSEYLLRFFAVLYAKNLVKGGEKYV